MTPPTITHTPDTRHPLEYEAAGATPRPIYKWLVVGMLWFVCFLNYGDRQAIFAVFPKLQSEFHFTKTQLGLIGSAFMWVYAFGAPMAGYIADRARRKDLILGGCLFWSFVTMMTGWCGKLWHFVTIRALEGFGETFYFPASMSLISDNHAPGTRSRALAFHQSSVYVGTIAGSVIAAALAERYNWRIGFYCFGGAGIVLALVLYRFLREPIRGQAEVLRGPAPLEPLSIRETARILFSKPTVILLMAAFIGANFVATIFLTWTPIFLVEKFTFNPVKAALWATAFIQTASAVGAPLGGVLADWLSARHVGGRILVQAGGLLIGSVFVFGFASTRRVPTLIEMMIFFGLCKGLYDSNIFASVYDFIDPRARSSAAGIMNTVGWSGGAAGPLVIGWFATHGRYGSEVANMSHAIAWTAGVYIIAAILLTCAALLYAPRDTIDP